jgi:hypothetical protein
LYTLFWILLWVPTRRLPRYIAVITAGLAAGSTILTVGFIPLALLRVLVRRDRTGIGILTMLVAGAAANALLIHNGGGAGRGVQYPYPLTMLPDYGIWALPTSVLGYRATIGLGLIHLPPAPSSQFWGVAGNYLGVIVVSWLMVLAIVAVAASRRFTRPAWLLAAVAAAHSVGLMAMMVMAQGNEQRYLLPVELLLFAALTLLLLPSDRLPAWRSRAPLVAFAVFVAVVSAFNYRWNDTYRSHAPRWSDQIAEATAACQRPSLVNVYVRSAPEPFGSLVLVPCHRLRDRPWDCDEPRCTLINGPTAPPVRRN